MVTHHTAVHYECTLQECARSVLFTNKYLFMNRSALTQSCSRTSTCLWKRAHSLSLVHEQVLNHEHKCTRLLLFTNKYLCIKKQQFTRLVVFTNKYLFMNKSALAWSCSGTSTCSGTSAFAWSCSRTSPGS